MQKILLLSLTNLFLNKGANLEKIEKIECKNSLVDIKLKSFVDACNTAE